LARGVEISGDDPHSVSSVRCAGVPSTHHERPAGVAERFQRSENPVCASSTEARDVLKACPNRSDFVDEADGLEEKSGAFSINTLAAGVSDAGVLAWRTADDDGRKVAEIGAKPGSGKVLDVGIKFYAFCSCCGADWH